VGRQGRSEGRIPGPFGGRIPGPFGIIGYPPGMAFMSIHTMEGDPDDLLARKWTEPGGAWSAGADAERRAGSGP
jgi:hypothetical protein